MGVDHEIERARRCESVQAKDLAQDSFDSVSRDRVSQFSGHGKSYAAVTLAVL